MQVCDCSVQLPRSAYWSSDDDLNLMGWILLQKIQAVKEAIAAMWDNAALMKQPLAQVQPNSKVARSAGQAGGSDVHGAAKGSRTSQ